MSNGWCDKHWEPYRTDIVNGLAATMFMIHELMHSPRFMRMCGWKPEKGEKADPELINRELERITMEFGAACCFLGDEVMNSILQKVRSATSGQR